MDTIDKISEVNYMIDRLVTNIQKWFEVNGKNCKAVLGISGGKDSTITAALLVKALGKDRVLGILMPNGIQSDIEDSKRVVEFLGIDSMIINIQNMYDAFLKNLTCHLDRTE